MAKLTEEIKENLPFISVIHYGGIEYVGIIINQDQYVTSIYNYEALRTEEERKKFVELGEAWWWESNRLIPINIFLRDDWSVFKPFLRTFNNKGLVIMHGPATSMSDLAKKRVKRKSVTLVRRMP